MRFQVRTHKWCAAMLVQVLRCWCEWSTLLVRCHWLVLALTPQCQWVSQWSPSSTLKVYPSTQRTLTPPLKVALVSAPFYMGYTDFYRGSTRTQKKVILSQNSLRHLLCWPKVALISTPVYIGVARGSPGSPGTHTQVTQLNSTQPEITDAGVNTSMSASLCSRFNLEIHILIKNGVGVQCILCYWTILIPLRRWYNTTGWST